MKIIFVDAENIGLKALEKIEASVVDKVFVFSKEDSVKRACEQALYLCLSDYPTGANQADFYLIAYLARVLSALPKTLLSECELALYTNDEHLITAFELQCRLFGGHCNIIRTQKDTVVTLTPLIKKAAPPITPKKSLESDAVKLFQALKSPRKLTPKLRDQLGFTQPEFNRAIQHLRDKKQIERSKNSKQQWIQSKKAS